PTTDMRPGGRFPCGSRARAPPLWITIRSVSHTPTVDERPFEVNHLRPTRPWRRDLFVRLVISPGFHYDQLLYIHRRAKRHAEPKKSIFLLPRCRDPWRARPCRPRRGRWRRPFPGRPHRPAPPPASPPRRPRVAR